MFIKQISVFVENRSGAILDITGPLQNAGINIRALSIADTSEFGIVRLIVDQNDQAVAALRDCGLTVIETDVIALSVSDAPGGFHAALCALQQADVAVEYAYAFVAPVGGGATVILRCTHPQLAAELLQKAGFRLLQQADVTV